LRARSFYIQILTEAAALRVLGELEWPRDNEHWLMSGAGKFLLKGTANGETENKLMILQQDFSSWLLQNTRGELRLSLGWADCVNEIESYRATMDALQRTKLRPWAPVLTEEWNPVTLVLAPLDKPCSLCGHAPSISIEVDGETGEERWVCDRCSADKKMGSQLPRARWLIFSNKPASTDIHLFNLGAHISEEALPPIDENIVGVANLRQPGEIPDWCPADLFINRSLMAYIPTDNGAPKWFVEIANQSRGDHLLGVLKADVDSLGCAFENLLKTSGDLKPLIRFSNEMDCFFTVFETGMEQAQTRDGGLSIRSLPEATTLSVHGCDV
jgi:CRISPR-associated protein Cas10/Csm1 subtype III-A